MTVLNVTRKPVTVIVQGRGLTGAQGVQGVQGVQGDKGEPGTPAPELEIQYSADNSSWSDTYTAGDFYARFSTDGGSTWKSGLLIRGEQGIQGYTGPKGDQGYTGPRGDQGSPGPKGDKGDPGNLTGPATSTDGNVPIFDGVGGDMLKDSGVKLSDKADVDDVADALALKADLTYIEYLMMEGDPA